VFYDHIFCFAFSKEKVCSRKKAVIPELLLPHSIYTHVCTLYTCTNTCLLRFSPSRFFGPSKCLVPTPRLTFWALQVSRPDPSAHIEHPMCRLCVCVRIHTHTPTDTPTRVKNTNTSWQDNTSISLSVQSNPPRQVTSTLHRLVEPPHPHPSTRMNKLRTHERMCTPCSDCFADMYGDVTITCGMCTPACTGAQDICLVHTTFTAKMHIHLCKHVRATVQQCRRHANHCGLYCNLSSTQETVRFHSSPWRSRNCVATQASSDYTPWWGPPLDCLSFAFAPGLCRCGDHPPQISISPFSWAGLFVVELQDHSLQFVDIYILTDAWVHVVICNDAASPRVLCVVGPSWPREFMRPFSRMVALGV